MIRDPHVLAEVCSTLDLLAAKSPGHAIEVRVPPYGAVQCGQGQRHTRGTPPNVIEMSSDTWLALADGSLDWEDAMTAGNIQASGVLADISQWLPVIEAKSAARG